LPLADASVDCSLIVAFSNRMFFSKAPQIWTDGGDRDHLAYVAEVLIAQGWPRPELIAEPTRASGPLGWIGGQGDPFFAVIATKPVPSTSRRTLCHVSSHDCHQRCLRQDRVPHR